MPVYGSAFTILCGVTHRQAAGASHRSGPGRNDAPVIDPHYLETEHDRAVSGWPRRRRALVGHHAALDEWRDVEVLPGASAQSDDELDAFIARAASTHHHPAGTCRMGSDAEAVVDPNLRLNGFENVFVVDASMMPAIPSGPINAAIVAIAETWTALAAHRKS